MQRSHYYTYKVGSEEHSVAKVSYPSEKDALLNATKFNAYGKDIHKLVAYKCSKCGMWHIGHNHTEMTDDLREKAKQRYKELCDESKKVR